MKRVEECEHYVWNFTSYIYIAFLIIGDRVNPDFMTGSNGYTLTVIGFVLGIRMIIVCLWDVVRVTLELWKEKKDER